MCFADSLVAADEGRQRDRLWRRKGGVPTGAMLSRLNRSAIHVLIFIRLTVLNELIACQRMQPFGEAGERLRVHWPREPKHLGELALPLARHFLPTAPIALVRRCEITRMIGLCLRCRKGL